MDVVKIGLRSRRHGLKNVIQVFASFFYHYLTSIYY